MLTVQELHKQNLPSNKPLLTEASYLWWTDYKENFTVLDNYFRRVYSSFRYAEGETLLDFQQDVSAILYINNKKYEELYRIYTVPDEVFNIASNYDMTETMARSNANESAMTTGQRTDLNNLQVGSQNTGLVNKVTAFNTNNENIQTSGTSQNGTRNDVSQFTKGQETDTTRGTETENYTLTRKGNIGVQTSADILRVSNDLIQSGCFEFYKMVFSDIYKELLLV